MVKGKSNKISSCTLCKGVRHDEGSTRVQLQEPSAQDALPWEEFLFSHFLKLAIRSKISGCREENRGRGQI